MLSVAAISRFMRGTVLEVMVQDYIRTAKAKGCKFVINTDAHHPKHLLNIQYGVRMARRGPAFVQ